MNLRGNLVPLLAVLSGASAAAFGLGMRPSPTAAPPITAEPSLPPVPIPDEDAPSSSDLALSGEVLERIDVEKYTYLRLGTPGTTGTWAAVPSAPNVLVGQRASVRNAELMSQFKSATLNRTFDTIYFGELDDGAPQAEQTTSAINPHAAPVAANGPLEKVSRAPGALGRTVAELWAERETLAGKPAQVRAVVVKVVEGVLGKNFLHVKDGTGGAGSDDLAVTTSALPAVGSQVLLEGTVQTDKDFGMGYRYPVLLEDARWVDEEPR